MVMGKLMKVPVMFMDLHKAGWDFSEEVIHVMIYIIWNVGLDLSGVESNPAALLSSGFISELLGILALVAKWVIF